MLGAAVWGAGWVSGEHLRAYQANPNTKVVAIGSLTRQDAQAKADELGLDCEVYDNLDEMLNRDDLHVVSITTPHHLHIPNLIQVAEAGKHVLVEKPLATTVADLQSGLEVIRRTRVKTLVGYVARWFPFFQMVHNLVDDGTLGDIVYLECNYFSEQGPWWPGFQWGITKAHGGSVMSVAACHAVDILCSLGGEVDEVFAYHTRRNRQDYEYEPTIAGVIKFKNGIVGSISSSFEVHAPMAFPLVIGGSKGSIREGKLHADRFLGQTAWISLPTVYPDSPDVGQAPFKPEIDHFVDCILNDRESFLSVERASLTTQVGLALDLSAESGKPVKLPLC